MKHHYTKRAILFALFGTIGFSIYNFGLRFIEPVAQTEITVHAIATATSLLLSAVGFLGAVYYSLNSLLYDEGVSGKRCSVKKKKTLFRFKKG